MLSFSSTTHQPKTPKTHSHTLSLSLSQGFFLIMRKTAASSPAQTTIFFGGGGGGGGGYYTKAFCIQSN
jgi:hypothetical protein